MKTVLFVTATGIVDNVIRIPSGTPFNPPPGISMLSVDDATPVGPGQRLIEGSAPPAFENVPDEEQPPLPDSEADALDAIKAQMQALSQAIANFDAIRG